MVCHDDALGPFLGLALRSYVAAIRVRAGEVVTDPAEMAAALRAHWQEVFDRRRVDEARLAQWLGEDLDRAGLPPPDHAAWRPRRSDVERAVAMSSSSSPGPDGLPSQAWRALGPLGIDVLYGVLREFTMDAGPRHLDLLLSGPDPALQFNRSTMVFLPKAPAGRRADGGEFYTADPSTL